MLSEQGIDILNATSELCYLTQIVMRLFEDNRWELNDPRRFRVEILFSPGATATPLHMHEQDRDSDPSRFDTAPLEMIGREGLTCQELEDFFHVAVMEGATETAEAEIENADIPMSTADSAMLANGVAAKASMVDNNIPKEIPILNPIEAGDVVTEELVGGAEDGLEKFEVNEIAAPVATEPQVVEPLDSDSSKPQPSPKEDEKRPEHVSDNDDDKSTTIRNLERKYFWSTVAVGSFVLAAGCLILALNIGSSGRRPQKYSTRRF